MANDKVSPTANFPISAKDFNSKDARATNKLIDYYEDDQLHHLEAIMSGKDGGRGERHNWKVKGMVPRNRNITKSIVDKSSGLFNAPPTLSILPEGSEVTVTDQVFNTIMESADWIQKFQNVDAYVRLLGTVVLLITKSIPFQANTVNGKYIFNAQAGESVDIQILHQGNCVVKTDPTNTRVLSLAYITVPPAPVCANGSTVTIGSETTWSYCLYTADEIIDVLVTGTGVAADAFEEQIVSREPNPDGFVPACFFYDTRKPRVNVWSKPSQALISAQEIYNLHLTDTEYSVAFQKGQLIVVTGPIKTQDQMQNQQVPTAMPGYTPGGELWKSGIPSFQQGTATHMGGLGTVVQVEPSMTGQGGELKFVGPDVNLLELQNVIMAELEGVASDWDVNLKYGGGGSATSGFQLVVEESNNLTLLKKRSQSMVAGMRKFYEIMKGLYVGQLTDGMLQVKFAPPELPVNQAEKEQIWSSRIDNNRASNIDYLMEVHNMTEQEAVEALAKIIAQNNAMNVAVVPPVPVAPPAPTTGEVADKGLKPVRPDLNNG